MNPTLPIALQLYSLRAECADLGLGPVLEEVSKMGYDGVEFAGFHGVTAKEATALLRNNGLKIAGAHIPIDNFLGDKLSETIDYHLELGNRYLIIPSLPEERTNSLEAWKKSAELINDLCEKLSEPGLRIGYHNHSVEFVAIDGVLPWDVFYGTASPDVIMQLDTGNALAGGAEVAPFIKKYPHRSLTVHLKEHSHDPEKIPVIGEGDVNWQEVFELCPKFGCTEWYIIEQEKYAQPPMECVQQCLNNVRRMLQSQ